MLTLLKAGLDIKSINIGGMAYRDGKKMITSAVAVDEKDIEAFKLLIKWEWNLMSAKYLMTAVSI